MKRSEFLASIPTALYALACGEDAPSTVGKPPATGGAGAAPGGSGSGSAPASGAPGGGSGGAGTGGAAISTGGSGGSATPTGGTGAATGGTPTSGGTTAGPSWNFDCGDPSLPQGTGALAREADFTPNSDTGSAESHVVYLNGYFLIRRTKNYVTEGDADHQHEILLTDDQIDQLIAGQTVVVQTNGPPLNASSGHAHMITIRSCFSV